MTVAELKYKSLYEDQEFDIYFIKGIVCKVKSFLPSTGQVIIDQVLSLGRAVTTTSWATWRHASKSTILAVKFRHFVKLTR